ncbi:hypothetical protein V6Z11_A03G154100 [Gossypium hirsutum]
MMEIGMTTGSNNVAGSFFTAPKKQSWKQLVPAKLPENRKSERVVGKRKSPEDAKSKDHIGMLHEDGLKRSKKEDMVRQRELLKDAVTENEGQDGVSNNLGSAAANRQADRT